VAMLDRNVLERLSGGLTNNCSWATHKSDELL